MKIERLIFVIILGIGLMIPTMSFAKGTKSTEALGIGYIINGDKAKARDDAIRDAQRNAVEQVSGTLVHSESEIENFMLKKDEILTRTQGYITEYKILKEKMGEDDMTYEVTIQAQVSLEPILNDFVEMNIIRQIGRVMIIIEEKKDGAVVDGRTAETVVTKAFKERHFTCVDPQFTEQLRQTQKMTAIQNGNYQEAVAIAANFGAEVLIVGEAIMTNQERKIYNTTVNQMMTTINARVIKTDNAHLVALGTAEAMNGLGNEHEALKMAADTLAVHLIPDIIFALYEEKTSKKLNVTISPLTFNQKTEFTDFLKYQIRGFEAIDTQTFQNETLMLVINTEGEDGNTFAHEFEQKKEALSFSASITTASPYQIRINVETERKTDTPTTEATITVDDIEYMQQKEFKDLLLQMTQISEVKDSEFTGGQLIVTVEIRGDIDDLATELNETRAQLSYPVKIIGVTADRVELKVSQ